MLQDRLDLVPILIHGLSENMQESAAHTANLFNLLLRILQFLKFPARGSDADLDLRAKLGLLDRPEDASFIAVWLGKVILFTTNRSEAQSCPGLSVEDCKFLQLYGKQDIWTPSTIGGLNLTETKIAAAKFLTSGAFVDSERFLPALFAAADPNSRISDIGDDILKRATPSISLEEHDLIKRLFSIYLGRQSDGESLPARVPLQIKILSLLCRSKEAATFAPQIIQVVQGGLASSSSASYETAPGPPKQGLESSKLRGQVFAFTNWVARVGPKTSISNIAPYLVHELRSYVERQGWPQYFDDDSRATLAELNSRSYGYESIGLLARACPADLLLEDNLDLLRWLFDSLSGDASGKDISISIEQALSSVIGAFSGDLNADIEEALTNLLLHHMNLKLGDNITSNSKVIRSTRFAAVRFANRCLSFSNTRARWINILAIGAGPSERSEVIEEGKKGLDPYWYRTLNPPEDVSVSGNPWTEIPKYHLPNCDALIDQFFATQPNGDQPQSGCDWKALAHAYGAAIIFCRCALLHQALESKHKAPIMDVDWKKSIDGLVMNDEMARAIIKEYLIETYKDDPSSRRPLLSYGHAAFSGFVEESHGDADQSGGCLLELCSLGPGFLLDNLASRVAELKSAIFANDHSSRHIASHVFGLLASRKSCRSDTTRSILDTFARVIASWDRAIGSEVHQAQGSILATAYWISRQRHREGAVHGMAEHDATFVTSVLAILSTSRDKELLDAAIVAIDQLSLFAVLSPGTVPTPYSASAVVEKLKERSKVGDEGAVLALGHFAMTCDEDDSKESILGNIIDTLYGVHENKQPELQFAVGSALSCAAVGWQSKSLVGIMDMEGQSPRAATRSRTLFSTLSQVLKNCQTTKPAMRQAAVIWLLCLVQYCGHFEEVQSQLRQCQAAFKGFLADRDSLNQETASRGLTLVYEQGDRGLKDDLIRDLVGSFTGTSAGLAGNVTEDTQLFEPGALPTGEGSVTTYKDIMNLAAEVGDPSLVYRFMSLASNNAIWSSRAAFGRFGLSNILSDSSVDGYLAQNPKLYPALFRYRFDPNTNVRSSMNEIWSALVKDPTVTLNLHFDNIMNDLLKSILGKEWRVRQASCGAIADLVQGKPLEKYEKYLTQMWTLTFKVLSPVLNPHFSIACSRNSKVCDDIKDSVRTAAMALARVLTGILTRSLEAGDSSASGANIMLKEILPFLLSPSGLESGAPEVQAFALKTLLQIIKSSNGKALRPFVPDLIGRLLGLLSSLEPQAVNYIHLNADKYGMTAQQIDDARLSSVRGSPMMEAIERCLDILDETSMTDLQRSLEEALKTAVGLPSKVGTSRAIVSLSTRHSFLFKPHAGYFLRLIRKLVLDRNDTISTSYAAACGYLARLASDDELLKLLGFSKKLYFDSEDDRHRAISGEIVHAVGKHATDRFASLAGEVLPFVFIAKHDPYERAKELFQDTWNENVGGSRAVLLYLKEIVSLAAQYLESPRWSIKHTSAFAIAEVVSSAGNESSPQNNEIIWPALEKAMSGKTWEGKENVLEAFIKFVKNSTLLTTNEKVADHMQVRGFLTTPSTIHDTIRAIG